MRVVFLGSPDLAAVILRALASGGHEIAGVVTGPDKARGRRGTPVPSDVGLLAEELGLPCLKTPKVRREEDLQWIREKEADVLIVAAFGQLLPAALLQMAPLGCINVHASLLPAYRGAAPIQWSVLNGEKETGVTIMQMDEGLDTGDILSQRTVPIGPEETSGSLFDKIAEAGGALLLETLPLLAEGKIEPVRQPQESTTAYAGRITKEMGEIDWTKSAARIDAWIRGMNPWPCAYTQIDGKTLKIWRAAPSSEEADAEPGRILSCGKEGIRVRAGSGSICLTEVQLEGRKRLSAADFLRGYSIKDPVLGRRVQ